MDPLAEEYVSWSPYNYTYNNPIKWIDPTGMGPEDWFVNKNTGNVVFIKNESTLTNLKDEKLKKQLGDVNNYERLGDDRMFGTNVKFEGIEGNLIEDYDNIVFNKNSEKFMSSQGYEKSSINLLERSEYEVKDFEGGGFDTNTNITKSSSTKGIEFHC